MTHNDFDFYEDLIRPLMRFLCQINILQKYEDSDDEEEPADDRRTNTLSRSATMKKFCKEEMSAAGSSAPKDNE